MKVRIALATVLILAIGLDIALAYLAPPKPVRWVSTNGGYYVVTIPQGKSALFHAIQRRPNTSHLEPVEGEKARIREIDIPLGKGYLSDHPRHVLVSSNGIGFISLDSWYDNTNTNVVALVNMQGDVLGKWKLRDILTADEIKGIGRLSYFPIHLWLRGAWIDEERKSAIVVISTGKVFSFSFETAQAREAKGEDIIKGALNSSVPCAMLAIELICERGITDAKDVMIRVYENKELDKGVRVRAAVALSLLGDARGLDFIIKLARTAVEREPRLYFGLMWLDGDRSYAIRNLPKVAGDRAIPILEELILKGDSQAASIASYALTQLGEKVIPFLKGILLNESLDYSTRARCLEALNSLSNLKAYPAVFKAVFSQDKKLAEYAARSLIQCKPYKYNEAGKYVDIGKYKARLIEALDNSDEYTVRIASECLGELEAEEALPALLKAVSHKISSAAEAAVHAAATIAGIRIADKLLEMLEKNSGNVEAIAAYFKRMMYKKSIPSLIKALDIATLGSRAKWELGEAIEVQLNVVIRYKMDPEVWRELIANPEKLKKLKSENPRQVPSTLGYKTYKKKNDALLEAVERGKIAEIKALLGKGAYVDILSWSRTPLICAINEGLFDVAKLLLEEGADPNLSNHRNKAPLHFAAEKGMIVIIRLLFERGAYPDIQDKEGSTPLHLASKENRAEIVKLLLEKGANIDISDLDNYSSLHLAAGRGGLEVVKTLIEKGANIHTADERGKQPLHEAVESEHLEIVRLLVEKGADVNGKYLSPQTPLILAICNCDVRTMRYLLSKGADVNANKGKNQMAIHCAAKYMSPAQIGILTQAGADINDRDPYQNTALHTALEFEMQANAIYLIENGADISAKNRAAKTPLISALKGNDKTIVDILLRRGVDVQAKTRDGRSVLHWAAEHCSAGLTKLFLEKGLDVNAKDNLGRMPLHLAAKAGKLGNAKALVEKGADLWVRSKGKKTPFHIAIEYDNDDVMDYLLSRGVDQAIVNDQDEDGKTILHKAIEDGSLYRAELLIGRRADVKLRDKQGRTTLHYIAEYCDNPDIAERLIENGADPNAKDARGWTPLKTAEENGNEDMVEFLKRHTK